MIVGFKAVDRTLYGGDNHRVKDTREAGVRLCLQCRRDTPIEDIVDYRKEGAVKNQLCKACYEDRERRVKAHTHRIQSSLRRMKRK